MVSIIYYCKLGKLVAEIKLLVLPASLISLAAICTAAVISKMLIFVDWCYFVSEQTDNRL